MMNVKNKVQFWVVRTTKSKTTGNCGTTTTYCYFAFPLILTPWKGWTTQIEKFNCVFTRFDKKRNQKATFSKNICLPVFQLLHLSISLTCPQCSRDRASASGRCPASGLTVSLNSQEFHTKEIFVRNSLHGALMSKYCTPMLRTEGLLKYIGSFLRS